MRTEFENILNENGVFDEDVEDVLYATVGILEYKINQLQQHEPFAVSTIDNLDNAIYEIVNIIEEYLEE